MVKQKLFPYKTNCTSVALQGITNELLKAIYSWPVADEVAHLQGTFLFIYAAFCLHLPQANASV